MRNETIGNNVLRFATASQLGSVPWKSAENAVFLRYLRGGFKSRGKIKLYQRRSYYAK